jgi:hypothetical protein
MPHLNILHIPFTNEKKIDDVAEERLKNLFIELDKQGITDYSIIEGFYDKANRKQAIHKGHRKIVQLAKDKGLGNCIIAEDDIVLSSPNAYKYFLSQIPESYDLFFGLIYAGTVENNQVKNGMSGVLTLYSISSRFYDFFLSLDTNTHLDRELGNTAYKHEYFVCNPEVVEQRGGYSFNLRQIMFYSTYMENKIMYKG